MATKDVRRREEGPLDFLDNLEIGVANYRASKALSATSSSTALIHSPDSTQLGAASSITSASVDADSSLAPSIPTAASLISNAVRSQVTDVLWLEDLKRQYAELEEMRSHAGDDQDRCVVCTLPYGTCKHTKSFMEARIDDTQDIVDREVQELLSFVGPPIEVKSVPQEEDVDMDAIRWVQLDPAMSDKIGTTYLSVYNPGPRGWHTCCRLQHYIVVFGGFRYKANAVPQPFGPASRGEDVEYLSELLIFDTIGRSWHQSPRRQDAPGGRYGHVAAALDDNRMLIYGGRSQGGRFLNDTWIYHLQEDKWVPLIPNVASPAPSPRMFAAACSFAPPNVTEKTRRRARSSRSARGSDVLDDTSALTENSESVGILHDIYLFGGTDGVDNFGDLWVFRGRRESFNGEGQGEMRWERTVAAGIPPAPRYGHRLIFVHESPQSNEAASIPASSSASRAHVSIAQHGRLVVVGGCTVSPQSEVVGVAMTTAEAKMMLDLGNNLQNAYLAEGLAAQYGGRYLESSAEMLAAQGGRGPIPGGVTAATGQAGQGPAAGVRGLYGIAAGVTQHLHELESVTREAEKSLVTQFHVMQASNTQKTQKAKHPNPLLDLIFLDVRDLTWKPQIYPRISGDVPCCRMHFGCVSVAGHIVVIGGTRPTSLAHAPVECSPGSTLSAGTPGPGGGGSTQILSLDLNTLRWSVRYTVDSREALTVPIEIALSDILRAKRRVSEETDRGRALGARNGMTIELAEAQAVLDVCKWRLKMLQRERDSLREPPPARWGHTLSAVGCRAFCLGGWTDEAVVPKGDTYILDMEHDGERRRREADEFHLKLDRDRKTEENRSTLFDMQSAYELRAMLQAEKANEARERRRMAAMEILSAVPPLSIPAPVQLLQASDHSMWVSWERLTKTVTGHAIDPSTVRYNLYMVNGYQHLSVEDRVLVKPIGAVGCIDPDATESEVGAGTEEGKDDVSVLSETSHVKLKTSKATTSVPGGSSVNKGTPSKKPANPYEGYDGPGFPGEIIAHGDDDRFSVSFDDGTFEKNVHRSRIKLTRPIYPDRLPIPTRRPEDDNSNDNNNNDDDDEGSIDVSVAKGKRRRNEMMKKYGHLLNDLNRDAMTIDSSMSWATQKRIMGKLKRRESTMAKLMRIHPTYRQGSVTATAAAATASSAGVAAGQSSPLSKVLPEMSLGSSDSEEDSDEEGHTDEREDDVEDDDLSDPQHGEGKRRRRKKKNQLRKHAGPFQPTISVPPEFSLIYSGNATFYEVTGIVPLEALRRDPRMTVPVKFVLQTSGTDFPTFDSSQLSQPAIYRTRMMPSAELLQQGLVRSDDDDDLSASDDEEAQDFLAKLRRKDQKPNTAGEPAGGPKPQAPLRTTTKKTLLETTLGGGKRVSLELLGHNVSGRGEGDHFM